MALQFRIMLYPEEVEGELIQDITRHFFFLEVNEKILSQEIYCPPEMAMMMAAYQAQALCGDYSEEIHKPGCLSIEDFIPQRVSCNCGGCVHWVLWSLVCPYHVSITLPLSHFPITLSPSHSSHHTPPSHSPHHTLPSHSPITYSPSHPLSPTSYTGTSAV